MFRGFVHQETHEIAHFVAILIVDDLTGPHGHGELPIFVIPAALRAAIAAARLEGETAGG